MDWFWSLFDKFMQSYLWRSVLSHFYWVDWITAVFLIGGLIYGIRKGLMREIAEIGELILIMVLVFRCRPKFSLFLRNHVESIPKDTVDVVSFIVLALLIWFAIFMIDRFLQNIFHTQLAGPVRTVGGALVGIFHALLFWSFLSQAIYWTPSLKVKRVYQHGASYSGQFVRELSLKIVHLFGG